MHTKCRNDTKSHQSISPQKVRRPRKKKKRVPKVLQLRDKESCPLNGNCLIPSIAYLSTVNRDHDSHNYIGISEGPFKNRHNVHSTSFLLEKYENSTELSKKIWELKRKNIKYNIKWRVLVKTQPIKSGTSICNLCLTEKYLILTSKLKNLLNNKTELISKCRHQNKFMLKKCL